VKEKGKKVSFTKGEVQGGRRRMGRGSDDGGGGVGRKTITGAIDLEKRLSQGKAFYSERLTRSNRGKDGTPSFWNLKQKSTQKKGRRKTIWSLITRGAP